MQKKSVTHWVFFDIATQSHVPRQQCVKEEKKLSQGRLLVYGRQCHGLYQARKEMLPDKTLDQKLIENIHRLVAVEFLKEGWQDEAGRTREFFEYFRELGNLLGEIRCIIEVQLGKFVFVIDLSVE